MWVLLSKVESYGTLGMKLYDKRQKRRRVSGSRIFMTCTKQEPASLSIFHFPNNFNLPFFLTSLIPLSLCSGLLGSLMLITGPIGAVIFGVIVEKTGKMIETVKCGLVIVCVSGTGGRKEGFNSSRPNKSRERVR